MSQYPGVDPTQQPWNNPPQQNPSATPGPAPTAPGPGYQPGYAAPSYPTQPGQPAQPGYPGQPAYPTQPQYAAQPQQPTQPGYAQPGYAGQPGYPTQPANPAPAQPGYGYQPQQYAAAPYQPVPASTGPKSPVLGFVALAVVVLTTLGSLAGGWLMLQQLQQFLASTVYTNSPSADEMQRAITGPIMGIGIAATIGFAGWVAGIVAAATNRGRVAGIVAIIVGVIAPFLIWGYIGLSFTAVVQQYR